MAPKITIRKNHIVLEPREGTSLHEIRGGLARLYYIPGFPDKNRIWVFREGPEDITVEDLQGLKEFVEENYPEHASIRKTAIVIETGFQAHMAATFQRIAADLPYEIRVFTDIESAEEWVDN